ncbi:MAG: PQQ-dependent sugar dehydrogenase, partial [Myxococcota bacterium]
LPVEATPTADECGAPAAATLEHAAVAEGHCAWLFADALSTPRGIVVDASGDVLVVERGEGQVTALYDDDGDRVSGESERSVLVPGSAGLGLNHGLFIHEGHLYASSTTTVYRWPYTAGARSELGTPEEVVHSLPSGGHFTRTLVAKDGDSWLYVSVGSESNVDDDSSRSRVMRYDLSSMPGGGYEWTEGEVFADGLRNEVGLAFDDQGRLWGVQNGVDNLSRDDLGGDIHNDNPAEEVNLLDEAGRFHGYPYCWTEFDLPSDVGMGPGTQWVHENFMGMEDWSDAWCRDPDNVVPPVFSMQAHLAPLDMMFYDGDGLAPAFEGDAFVANHGSWNRVPAVGYDVVRLVFTGPSAIARADPVLEYVGSGVNNPVEWPHRPVGLAMAEDGALLVTSDASDRVLAVGATR